MTLRSQRTETKARVAHAAAGAVILLEAFTKLTEHALAEGAVLAVLGLAMLLFAAFHERIHGSAVARFADAIAFLIEATVQGVVAWSYAHHGKHLLPWVFVAVCLCYLTLAVWRLTRPQAHGAHAKSSAGIH